MAASLARLTVVLTAVGSVATKVDSLDAMMGMPMEYRLAALTVVSSERPKAVAMEHLSVDQLDYHWVFLKAGWTVGY